MEVYLQLGEYRPYATRSNDCKKKHFMCFLYCQCIDTHSSNLFKNYYANGKYLQHCQAKGVIIDKTH